MPDTSDQRIRIESSLRDMTTPGNTVREWMRADWDRRAREDACYYAAFGRRRQTRDEFFASAADVLRTLHDEFRRFPPETDFKKLTALEIGCGPGRLMAPLSGVFGRIWGVDVSSEMLALARQNLAGVAHAELRQSGGADLAGFPDESVDFCYSYAVFQHIPEKDVIWSYLREACRVLKPGGILKCQFNGLPHVRDESEGFPAVNGWTARAGTPAARSKEKFHPNTWSGVSFCAEEIAHFAARHDLQLLWFDGFNTQYLWATMGKPGAGTPAALAPTSAARIVRVANTVTADAVVPQSGRFASASLQVLGLPKDADLNSLRVEVDGVDTAPSFIGKHVWTGPTQVNLYLPPATRSGVLPLRLKLLGKPISNTARLRVASPGPLVPRLLSVTDSVNLLSKQAVESSAVKVNIEEVTYDNEEQVRRAISAEFEGQPVTEMEVFCVDPLPRRYEISLAVPAGLSAGEHLLTLRLGSRKFPPIAIHVAA